MGRNRERKNSGLEPNLYIEKGRYYRYRHPITKEWVRFGTDKRKANAAAKALNARYAENCDLVGLAEGVLGRTFADVVTEFKTHEIQNRPWDDRTRKNYIFKLNRFERAFGDKPVASITRQFLVEWLRENTRSNESFNKNRERLVDLFAYARSLGWVDQNEAEMVLKRSLSIKIASNRKQRGRLEMPEFWKIHACAAPWLQVAMELALVTLQARNEVVHMRYADIRNGSLYVIRDKTSGDSDMAFIRIKVTPQIEQIVARSQDGIVSPYVVHYAPLKRKREQMEAKEHWTAVTPEYLTRTFRKTREAAGMFMESEASARPTFHEIRSLGARTYQALGYTRDYIRGLMTHSDQKTTRIYLAGEKLTDEHYIPVQADLDLSTVIPS